MKYPNELQPHVQRLDTINRSVDVEGKKISIQRIVSLDYNVPAWVLKMFSTTSQGYAVENATCELKKKHLIIRSSNITMSSCLKVDELCEYTVHPTNPNWTLYRQEARYTVFGVGFISSALEKMAVRTAAEKATSGLKAMQQIIGKLDIFNRKDS